MVRRNRSFVRRYRRSRLMRQLPLRRKFRRANLNIGASRSRLNFKMQHHHFCRGYSGGIVISSTIANTQYFAYNFQPNSMVNPTDFTNLYDQYRMNKIVMKFRLVSDPAGAGGSTSTNTGALVPRLFWYIDYDDATTPASLNEMRERAKCKLAPLSAYKPIVVKWTPSCLVTGYESGVSSMYIPKFKQWVDMADFGTQFFGIKFAIDEFSNVATPFAVEIEVKYYFSCKNVR